MNDDDWMTVEEQQPIQEWAIQTYAEMTDDELRGLLVHVNPDVLRGEDRSSMARHRNHRKGHVSLADDLALRASYAPIKMPFGKSNRP